MTEIQKLFEDYRKNKSQIADLKLKNENWLDIINNVELVIDDADINEVIAGECLNAATLSDIPKSVTNKFSSTTENVALNYHNVDQDRNNQLNKPEMRGKIRVNEIEIRRLERKVRYVDEVYMIALTAKEKFIMQEFYIEGNTWNDVARMYQDKFKEPKEPESLKKTRTTALKKLEEMLLSKSA